MSFLLTPSQGRTLDLSTHLSVTANAGAGKTSVLARRFVEIFIRTDARLPEVVAITFTEQAAGELRNRIHDVILERERGPGTEKAVRLRLAALRNQLSSAVIGTIHSFCARILRMYPAEADIDASFGVVEGQERVRLVTESIAETFEEFMGRVYGSRPGQEFLELLRAVPPAKLERFLERMFSRREQLHRLLSRRSARQQGEGAAGETDAAAIRAEVVRKAVEMNWAGMAVETARAAGGKDAARLLAILGDWARQPEPDRMAEILAAADGLIFTKESGFRKSFLGTVAAEDLPLRSAGILREFDSRYAGVLRALGSEGAEERSRRYGRLIVALESLFTAAQERYRVKKDDLGLLDFEDLQIMTRGLLERDGIRERLQTEYRWFLVDEFQDTNDLQYGILKGLLGDYRRGNLFIVGDPKQSIYGFRNADVGVFYDARDDIARALGSRGAGDAGSVVLEESFRPLPAIAAFVNTVFSILMRRGGSRYEVDYNRIVVGRNPGGEGAVEMLLVPPDQGRERAFAIRAEAALLAGRLLEIAGGSDPAGYVFGQCAVLLRDRTNLPALEKAFEEAGIPYLLAGGVGFFQTQEVYDFLNYLKFLVAADDDPALAGILRSPFFGLTDEDLYEISKISQIPEVPKIPGVIPGTPAEPASPAGRPGRNPEDMPLREKLRLAATDPSSAGRIRRAERLLSSHRALADRVPVPRLLRRIAADTGWLGSMAGLSHGPQHRENFLKLLELARSRGPSGPMSLYDFTVYLEGRAEEEEREGQAATAASGKAVRIMTIHAAKGLEFPVVFLPFLDRVSRGDSEPLIHPVFGIGFRPGAVDEEDEEASPEYEFLKALSEEKRVAEEKRILYVGCTRAKDVLVLSACATEMTTGISPLGWLRGVMAASGVAERDSAYDFGEQRVLCLEREGGKQEYRERVVHLRVRIRRPGEPAAAPPGTTAIPPRTVRRILTGPLTDTRGGETYSATGLAAYMTCPTLYYLRYVLGAGDEARESGGEGMDARPAVPGRAALEGELTHQVLSGLHAPVPEESVAGRVAEMALSRGDRPADPALEARVAENVTAFLRSAAGRSILSGGDARVEFQISSLLGDAVVTGKIDRLFSDADGMVEFVDYKTDAVSVDGVSSRAEVHKPQIAVYAYLISRLYAQSAVRGTVLFVKAPSAPVTYTFDAEELGAIEQKLRDCIGAIRGGRFTPPGAPCTGCPGAGGPHCPVIPACS